MLRSLKALHGHTVLAKDGDIGRVSDFYFHDDTWVIRYLVVDTGHWLPGRKVLVATGALGQPNWAGFNFPVALTRQQVEKSPDIDTDKPVSRQHESDLHNHYGWPLYWLEPGPEAWPPFVPLAPIPSPTEPPAPSPKERADPRLRSVREVTGYHIHASDGTLGHVEDFITDDAQWIIRYLVVHAGRVLPAKKVLISPQWLGEISYAESQVNVTLTRDKILKCPEFYPGAGINRQYEERIYDYYGRPTYWEDELPASKTNRRAA
jgi:hypothetical protein